MIQNKEVKVIGLTGGIGSGKSTVSRMLRGLGARIIDADIISKELMQKGGSLLEEVTKHFGKEILLADGNLNRKKMANIIFSDRQKRQLLNDISHPKIIDEIKTRLENIKKMGEHDVIVIDCALLFEIGLDQLVDESWLVFVSEEVQISRLMTRDGLSVKEALNRINSQMSLAEKREKSDAFIDNSGSIENTQSQIFDLWMCN